MPFEGTKASLFDLLEDLDADECLGKAQKIAGVSGVASPKAGKPCRRSCSSSRTR